MSVIEYGVIETPARMAHQDRLDYIFNDLLRLIKKYQPQKAAVEQLFFHKNAKTALKVGEARGVLNHYLSHLIGRKPRLHQYLGQLWH